MFSFLFFNACLNGINTDGTMSVRFFLSNFELLPVATANLKQERFVTAKDKKGVQSK